MPLPAKLQPLLAVILRLAFVAALLLFFHGFFQPETVLKSSMTGIINAHEHLDSRESAERYLVSAKNLGIRHTVLLGSPKATLEPGLNGFQHAEENNELILQLAKENPKSFSAFPTLDPLDPQKLEKLKGYTARGARGLKLYGGHQFFHRSSLDDAAMLPVYDYCEKNRIPVVFHVNAALYLAEFESVLQKFPKLKVICPHYCLSTIRTDRFSRLMDLYPNLYTDTSFGFVEYFKEALLRFSKRAQTYRELMLRYQDRILFGLDLVVTREPYKTQPWMEGMIRGYRDVLERDGFFFSELPGVPLRGFQLEPKVLEKIYFRNFEHLMEGSK